MDSFLKTSDVTDTVGLTTQQGIDAFQEADLNNLDLDTATENAANNLKIEKLQNVTPKLKEYISREPANAASVSEDLDKLSNYERVMGKVFTSGTRATKTNNIASKAYDLMMGNITSAQELQDANNYIKNEARELGYLSVYDQPDDKWYITLPGTVSTGILGMVDSITRNPKTAFAGASAGLPFGPVGVATGALLTAGTKQTYISTAGQIWYDQFINQPDDIKKNIDQEYVKEIAIGTAIVASGLEAGSTLLLGGSVSKAAESTALKAITAKNVSKMMTEYSLKGTINPILQSLSVLGKTAMTEFTRQGVIAGVQNSVQQAGQILASPEQNPTQFSTDQLLDSILAGTATGLLFRGAGALASKIPLRDKNVGPSDGGSNGPPRDVTPQGPPQLPGPKDGGGSPIIDVEVISDVSKPTTGTGEARPAAPPKTLEMIFFERNLRERIKGAEELKQTITEIADDLKDAKSFNTPAMESALSKITPEDAYFYIDHDSIQKMESERAGSIKAFERSTGVVLDENQNIYTVSASELFKLYSEDKRILDYIKRDPIEASLDSLRLADEKWKNELTVNTIFDGIGVEPTSEADRAKMDSKIHQIMMEVLDGVYNRETYALRPFIDEYIKATVPMQVVNDLENATIEERVKIAEEVIQKVKKEEDRLIFADVKQQLPKIEQRIQDEINQDVSFDVERAFKPGAMLSENFMNALRSKPIGDENASIDNVQGLSDEQITILFRSKHKSKKVYSPLAFDYSTLPEDIKDIWKNQRVKAKGVFVKGGLDYYKYGEAIAKAFTVNVNGQLVPLFRGKNPAKEMMAQILTKETTDEYYERRYNEELKVEFATSELYNTKLQPDYENAFARRKNTINEMVNIGVNQPKALINFIKLLGRDFNGKKGSKGDYLYNQAEITAVYYAYALKVKDLNPKIYSTNYKKFLRKASDALAAGKFPEFFRYKYNQALNDFLEDNAIKLRKAIQDRIKYVAKLNTEDNKQTLYRAGQQYADAFYAIVDSINGNVFSYVDLQKVITIINQYRDQNDVIPQSIYNLAKRATRFQVGNLTAAEALGLLDTAISIHTAATNDLLIKRDQEIIQTRDLEQIIEADLSSRPESDPSRFKKVSGQLEQRSNPDSDDTKQIKKELLEAAIDPITTIGIGTLNAYNIVRELDYGKEKGFYSSKITDPIIEAHALRGQYNNTFFKWLSDSAEKHYGIKDFNQIQRKTFTISELKNDDRFPDKIVSQFDLIYMIGLFGDKSGRERLLRDLGFKEEEMLAILEKYSTPEDLRFVSDMHKYFRNIDFERTVENHKKRNLPPPVAVVPETYNMHGQEWLGGYWPISSHFDLADQILTKQATVIDDIINGRITRMNVFSINTFDGSLESRNKNAVTTLRYSFNDFINIVRIKNHNHAFAQTMLDMGKIFGNRNIQKSMINFLGLKKYANLLGTIQNVATGKTDYDTTYQQYFDFSTNRYLRRGYKNIYVGALGFGVGTAIKQALGIPTMVNALIQQYNGSLKEGGVEFFKESFQQAMISIASPRDFRESIKAIALVSPQFQENLNQLAKYSTWRALLDIEEVIDVRPIERNYNWIEQWYQFADASMTHILLAQLSINTVMWKIAYKSAMEGKIIGIEANDQKSAFIFADKMVNKTGSDSSGLDRSPMQRQMVGQMFFAFKNQINLQANELVSGFQMLATEYKNQKQVTSKATVGAIMTILANSIVPVTAGVVSAQLVDSIKQRVFDTEQQKYEPKPLQEIMLNTLGSHPISDLFISPIESNVVYGQRVENIRLRNPFLDTGTAFLQTLVLAIDATTNAMTPEIEPPAVTQERTKIALRLLGTLGAVPSFNQPFGQSGKEALFDFIVKDLLSLPSRKEYLSKAKGGGQGFSFLPGYETKLPPLDAEGVNPAVLANEGKTPVKTESQFLQDMFDDAVAKIKSGQLSKELKSHYEQVRDTLYSVKGYTNPEGNEITTSQGVVKFDDYGRDFFTVTIDAIARLESGARPGLVSPSGAKGYFQFLDSTWRGLAELYPNFNLPANANLASKELQYQIYWKFLGENLKRLDRLNQEWTSENIFLSHMMSPDEFKTFLNADMDQDLTDVLPTQFQYNPKIMAGRTKRNILTNLERLLDKYKVEAEQFLKSENLLTSQE